MFVRVCVCVYVLRFTYTYAPTNRRLCEREFELFHCLSSVLPSFIRHALEHIDLRCEFASEQVIHIYVAL